ncbi:chromate transporter [Egicoccus sp. AB-alg6-2]|uniref:chromate transporter n=1 Tax=Egicoccus sp. AB-alg6-2 TaxID=3242692 RepID=UPI00359CD779
MGNLRILVAFLGIGATTFGGMWAATHKLEADLVTHRQWLTRDELQGLLVVSTLIPAPKFLSLGGLVGFKMHGWSGAASAIVGLIAPGASMVVAGAALVRPELLEGALAPLNTAVGTAIVGLLFGNAYHQLRSGRLPKRQRTVGVALSIVIFGTIVAGVPLIVAAFVGFGVGAAFIRPAAASSEPVERSDDG